VRGSLASAAQGEFQLDFLPLLAHESCVLLTAPHSVRAFAAPWLDCDETDGSQLLCPLLTSAPCSHALRRAQSVLGLKTRRGHLIRVRGGNSNC
jgi:hypothetical protein